MRKPPAVALALITALVLAVLGGLLYDQQRGAVTAATGPQAAEAFDPLGDLSARAKIEVPADPNLLIMGDSYTQGFGAADEAAQGWAPLVREGLGWNGTIDGIGGTGWTWGGADDGIDPNKYTDRIARLASDGYTPNVIIFQGGQNDYRVPFAEITDTVANTIDQARTAWPGVQVIVMGPSAPMPLGETTLGANNAIVAGALRANAAIINPLARQWFTAENSPLYAFADGAHLNTAGHRYLADKVLAELPEIGFPEPTPAP